MAQNNSIEALIGRLQQMENGGKYISTLKDQAQKAMSAALYSSVVEMSKKLKPNFDRIVEEGFYDKYTPHHYIRRKSMKDVLPDGDFDIDEMGTDEGASVFVNIKTNKSAMRFRKGGTNLIFLTLGSGYHGGASGTDRNGATVKSPHYRTPMGFWSKWLRPAVKTESPWQLYKKWFEGYWSDETFQPLFENHFYPKFQEALIDYMNEFKI